jgi:hypothetical protein
MIGLANVILDHLILEGKAKPMIVVMPDGYGDPEIIGKGTNVYWDDSVRARQVSISSI